MPLQTSGQISHTDIMAEFSEPAGAWRLSQDGGLLLQSVGDPKGPGSMIRETDFYGVSAVTPAPSGTFVMRPTESYFRYPEYAYYRGGHPIWGSGSFFTGSFNTPLPFYFQAWNNQLIAKNASQLGSGGFNISSGPGPGPAVDTISNTVWLWFGGVNMQSQLGVGAWDASWVMNQWKIGYNYLVQRPTSFPGGFNPQGSLNHMRINLQQMDGVQNTGFNSAGLPIQGADHPTAPNGNITIPSRPGSQRWENAIGANPSFADTNLPFNTTSGLAGTTTNFTEDLGAISRHVATGKNVSQVSTETGGIFAPTTTWSLQQLAAEDVHWGNQITSRRDMQVQIRDVFIQISFA